MAIIESHLGDPYVWGGTGPHGEDCSGLVLEGAQGCGFTCPRTSQEQFAQLTPVKGVPGRGDLIIFNVPTDSPPEAAHIGVCTNEGCTLMIHAPHTGTVVQESSTDPTGWGTIAGYRTFPYSTPSPIPQEEDMGFTCTDPASGKVLATDADGALYAENGIEPPLSIGNLVQHPNYGAGSEESEGTNPCIGITPWLGPDGQWGWCFITKPSSGQGGFGPYDLYHFRRDGTPD